ncbi:MAG: hypothetical protein QNJ78_07840 [Gammaproteobacteria bacterium]|nr:hypothetical protein [Gammaproteobacteria bacterium]
MNSFAAKLRLKGMAEEDIYFARLDQELIEALRQKKRDRQRGTSAENRKTAPLRH